ncbi:G-protein coupled receptor 182-like [Electrophorus electricus]|uniref:G-protein coupled receptors family 1 profile domain-containing protein n=1 Tax=Electrophorus electricus TaxID=8005 RepID=A0AAY5F0X6_ELEEL|nr:G-protein coupled receptor 182-like [Electrophorus electricus]XP_035377246.1 G-protein coupled receptor 182-like [Electrophorus electricus]XP_035377247.1 G-protein coupled receptor 182-like [Electrophorus electricus]XP_035377248.1 G-protein coupled receptor 182-like [Electrophorus electricus]
MTHELNTTDHELWFYECTFELDRDSRHIALFLLYLLLFVVGLFENSLVVWVNWRRRHAASGVFFCVINVSLSDLMVVLVMPFYMLEVTMDKVWLWGRFLCKVTHLVYVINFYSSSFFLALMTLERYLSVTRPTATPVCFPARPRHRRWLACAAVWLLSLVLALLENVHVDLLEWSEPGCFMVPEWNYTEWFVTVTFLCLIFQFLGPAGIIVTCNVLIAQAARASPEVQSRRDLWLVHVYSVVFLACWLPYHLVMFLLMVDDLNPHLLSCNVIEVLYFTLSVAQCLTLFHCIANPILYNFLSRSFRANLIEDVVARITSPPANAAGGVGAAAGKARALSNASTSHSDLDS